jgi:hypothetical protein
MKVAVKRLIRNEKGQAMLLALILLLVGGLMSASLLAYMGTGLLAGEVYETRTAELYAADAGVEDAVWKIQNGEVALCPGNPTYNYTISDVNDKSVAVNITYVNNITNTVTYLVESTAIGDGSGTKIDAYITGTILSADYSGISQHIITTKEGDLEDIKKKVDLVYGNSTNGPAANYSGDWPILALLGPFYWEQAGNGTPYNSPIDLNGQDTTLQGGYVNGILEIKNSSNTAATLKLTGTLYVTDDTFVGTEKQSFTLDLNGQTIFVESDTVGVQNHYALEIGDRCTIQGLGAIIAVGDIKFAPNGNAGSDGNPVFVLSILGTTIIRPGINIYGAVAGYVDVDIQSGNNPTITYQWGSGINFPGLIEAGRISNIASWEVNQL